MPGPMQEDDTPIEVQLLTGEYLPARLIAANEFFWSLMMFFFRLPLAFPGAARRESAEC